MNFMAVVEGILFLVGDDGISFDKLKEILEIDEEKLKEILRNLINSYKDSNRGIKLEYLGNKFKLTTKKEHMEYYQKLTTDEANSNLTPSALETLAIIAYNQPITRIKVDEIRGINSSHQIRKLLLKNLIQECGKSDSPGRPNLYSTTDLFLDYFGLKTIEELPVLEEVELDLEEKNLFESKYKETL